MILKTLLGLFLSSLALSATWQYGGIKHDITSQVGTASAIIMNAASTQVQRITGSTAQTIKLPDATTLRAGYWYTLVNESSAAVTVQNSSAFTLGTLAAASTGAPTYATLYVTSNSTSGGPWTFQKDQNSGGGSGGDSVFKSTTITSHGFSVGDILYLNGSTWTKAIATSAAAAESIAMVTTVTDANTVVLTYSGYVSGLSGLTDGTVYFLSPSSAGTMTATEPSTVGQVSKPVGVALSSTTLRMFDSSRAAIIGGSAGTTYGLVGIMKISGCSGGNFNTTSTTYAALGTSTGCTYTPTNGSATFSTPGTNVAGFTATSVPAGTYQITYTGAVGNINSNGKACYYQFSDGTTTSNEDMQIMSGSQATIAPSMSSTITFGSAGAHTIDIRGKMESGGNTDCRIGRDLNGVYVGSQTITMVRLY